MKPLKYYAAFIFYFTVEMFVPLFAAVLINIHNTDKNGVIHMSVTLILLLILSRLITRKFPLAYIYILVPAGIIMMMLFGSYWLTAILLTGFAVWTLEQLYDNINNHHNETMMMIMLGLLIIINLIRSEAIAEEAILLHMIAISMFIFYFLGRAVMLMTGSGYKFSQQLLNFAVISAALLSAAAIFTLAYKYVVFGIQTAFIFLLNGFIMLLRPFFSFLETVEWKFPEMPQEEMEVNESGDAVEDTFERESIINDTPVMAILLTVLIIGCAIVLIIYFKKRSRPEKEKIQTAAYRTSIESIQTKAFTEENQPPPNSKVRKEYYAFEKWLAKRKLGRYYGETIDEWSSRVNINNHAMIEQYKRYRYDSKDLTALELAEFKNMIRQLKKNLEDKNS